VVVLHIVKEVLNTREISECAARFTIFAAMSSKEQKFTTSRVRSSYLSVVISMTLVLFVVGVLGHLVLSAKDLGKAVRENFTFTLVLDESVPEEELRTLLKSQQLANYSKNATLITKEDAALQLQEDLGEDFVDFLGYNPLSNTIDINLNADFVASGDLETLKASLLEDDYIKDVLYDPDLIGLVNQNIEKITILLIAASVVLLIVALALINSSIRLTIYSKRFLLKTMQLVGATSAFIRRPYVLTSILLGLVSAVLSLLLLYGLGVALESYFPAISALFSVQTTTFVLAAVVALSILVPGVSTAVAIRRYLKLRTNELYY
jgi:cell division transport system permease protein